ncbi:dTDP-4-dehydrorhamnose reductase [Erythrobacter sp. HA6-11]
MKALLTGGTGQLGKALLQSVPDGWSVTAPDRSQLDLADAASIRATVLSVQPDWVINAGAFTAVDKAESEPELAQRINAEAPRILAQSIAEQGKGRLLQVSTDFVFDGAASEPYQPVDERNPLSVYGQSKAAGEVAAGPDALIVRTSWVYAADGANFVRTMLRLMRERGEVRVVADQIGAPTWANSLAEQIWALAAQNRAGTWHCTDSGTASWHQFAEAIAEEALALGLLDSPVKVVPITTADYPTPAHRPAYSVLDCSATAEALGKQAPHWRDSLREMLKEEQALG